MIGSKSKHFVWVSAVIIIVGFLFAEMRLQNKQTRHITIGDASFTVEIAQTPAELERGLSGRDPLPDRYGMLFVFGTVDRHAFWMKDMKFPLDFIWIKDNKVVDITSHVAAPTANGALTIYYPKEPINYMLEVTAGQAEIAGIQVGDIVAESVQ